MFVAVTDVNALLVGIESHARAGNFDHVAIQTGILLEQLDAAIRAGADDSSAYRKALPSVQALISDSARYDWRAVLQHVHEAQEALGIRPQ